MSFRKKELAVVVMVLSALLVLVTGCNTTRHVKEGEHLLRANNIKLRTPDGMSNKKEVKANLEGLTVQKPNSRWAGLFPVKLYLFNLRYEKYKKDSAKIKGVEKPVIYDSSTIRKTLINMKGYLFHKGYFYADVQDTTRYSGKKAYVTYDINAGPNYLINKVHFDGDNPEVLMVLAFALKDTRLKKNKEFEYVMLDEERIRLTNVLRNAGYYYFSNDNISFVLDTMNKQYLEDIENPFENAFNFVSQQSDKKKPTLDIKIIIRKGNEPKSYTRYGIGTVRVFPDYRSIADIRDTNMIEKTVESTLFKYHKYHVHEDVLYKHILMRTGRYYKQDDYDKTISRLNELGVFQSVRIFMREDTVNKEKGPAINTTILLTPTDRYDFSPSFEITNGSIYNAGTGVNVALRNRNVGKGANLMTLSGNGAVEYDIDKGNFKLLTRRLGANLSIDFPKFLLPAGRRLSAHYSNAPRTVTSVGFNLLDRVAFFSLTNISGNLTYRWHESETKMWEVTPVFVNQIDLYNVSPAFAERLAGNQFLRNIYSPTFVEGQSISFIYSNKEKKRGRSYSYLRIGAEEAGAIVGGVKSIVGDTSKGYSKYFKVDIDMQHFIRRLHSTLAMRLYTGIGVPYGHSRTLPYIKQYFSGGPYSIRGWQLRRLGPGAAPVNTASSSSVFDDRTGDIKLEATAEYRFDITTMFGGTTLLNGAVFTDAGNIWLANTSEDYPKGKFAVNKLWHSTAISSGVGLRFDIASLLVLRVDMGVRMKDPTLDTDGSNWVVGKTGWPWGRNLNTNIAIGYPF